MHVCAWGFHLSLSPLPSHQPFSFTLPLAADWVSKLGKGAARQNSPACRLILWGGKALDCAAWERSSGPWCLAGAQSEASAAEHSQWEAGILHLQAQKAEYAQRNQRNHQSLYADTLTRITFSRKILSPSQDKLNYVHETTSINK